MIRLTTTLAFTSLLLSTLAAQDDHENTAPTAWRMQSPQTPAQVAATANAGYRMIDIEVRTTVPLTFATTWVKDQGTYDKAWWWYFGKTAAEVKSLITSSRRLVKLTPYVAGGSTRYCAIFVGNSGSAKKGWYWWHGTSLSYIRGRCSTLGARLVDVESHVLSGNRYYCGVAIVNSGSDYRVWKVLQDQTSATIPTHTANNYRVYDIERTAPGVYDVIYMRPQTGVSSWWYVGKTIAQLDALVEQNGARIFDTERYVVNGSAYFCALMIQNTNALTARIGRQLRQDTDGSRGFILKQLGGTSHASLMPDFEFDPASTIKQLHGAYAYRKALTQQGITENSSIPYRDGPCPYTTGNLKSEPLENAVRMVLEQSDNRLTDAIERRFGGKAALHAFADSLGMTSTRSNRIMGCTAPPHNSMTLNDLVRLHTQIKGGLLGKYRDDFIDRMLNSRSGFPGIGTNYMGTVLSTERTKAGLTAAEYQMFSDRFELAYKPGAKTVLGKYYRTTSGWAQIPFVVNNVIQLRQFVWGAFAHGASNDLDAKNAISKAVHELLRDRIAAAMRTFDGFDLGGFTKYGTSCKIGSTTPVHSGSGYPVIGHDAYLILANAPKSNPALLWIGVAKQAVSLTGVGAPGCRLYVSPDLAVGASTTALGNLIFRVSLPNSKNLVGLSAYSQFAISALGVNVAGFTTTNGLETLIGGTK